MADEGQDQSTAAEPAEEKKASGGLLSNPMILGGILVTMMAAEAAVLYIVLPSPSSAAAGVEDDEFAAEDDGGVRPVEAEVDNFSSTNSRAAPGSVIHLTFKLTALVAESQKTAFEQAANEDNKARVRQAVIKVARSASLEDLNDPSLTTFKRLIREEINKILRKSYIIEVVINDFKIMEQ
ncbi:flagellar basal body-associated FliL family protein [Stratiformator vulcanicus]|uniref:Flagellar protein FliL n=1 Tax=Stratiformator vulcanicus TaxID=2527980 RepID=A0A517R5C7_9PLAN|nr:flagellar basal body-associated FliL family protein [Stratiformator vulcanicus]QDT39049.1 hypothetical protein Pan189_34510 [Stratiformator vulcanicus]